jgi:hypothetical protein
MTVRIPQPWRVDRHRRAAGHRRPSRLRTALRSRRFIAQLGVGVLVAAGLTTFAASPASAAAGCQVTYTVRGQWNTGFTGDLLITNLGDPLTSWSLTYTFPGNQQVSNGWNGSFNQSGSRVTVTNNAWNGAIPTNGTANPGFNASYSGTNTAPTDFALNGVACVGPNAAPSTTITSPGTNARFTAPASITINASATDPNSGDTISKVEFYHDGLLLGTDTSAPYSYVWSAVPAQTASYQLQTKAYDSGGAVGTSTAVPVFVDPFAGPSIQATPSAIVVPENGTATFAVRLSTAPTANVSVAVARTAGDADLTATPTTLTFTPANYATAQTVTVRAAEDADTTGGAATFSLTATGQAAATVTATESDNDQAGGEYVQRFLTQYNKVKTGGYFSPEGVPYHSVETLLVEAPDHGHETTSEAFSFWLWLEAQYGRVQGDWAPFNNAWTIMEKYIIPSATDQPSTASGYNPADPADYAPEANQPSLYPTVGGKLDATVKVGADPLANELASAYGNNQIYGMHWIIDVDNVYGYGKCGDGTTRPAYINTYQRGSQESVFETVAHPSCETFKYGKVDNGGFLPLFIGDSSYAKQWRFTDAPDADARAVQAAYWALTWAKAQGKASQISATVAKAAKMGDYLRYAMYDKYFKKPGCTSTACAAGTGKDSANYLLSWYYAWGGAMDGSWAWRIGASSNHGGYQNPFAAWALSTVTELNPKSPTAKSDWATSLTRQIEFYTWLQSTEGAIAGGATNSWNGNYSAPPAGTPTFYNLAYEVAPVYNDPPSNQWFGFQAWTMERVAEYYYTSGDAKAKAVLDKWVTWALANTTVGAGGAYQVPSTLAWSGAPTTWNPASPAANSNLHVSIVDYTNDVGVTAAYARTLIYYGAKANHAGSKTTAKGLLDAMWQHQDAKGVSVTETRADYNRFDDVWTSSNQQGLYIPPGYSGVMPNGDQIAPGKSFLDIRSFYKNDPDWPKVQAYLDGGPAPTFNYHRFWAQSDVATAMAVYGELFP